MTTILPMPKLGRAVALDRGLMTSETPQAGIVHLGFGNFHRAHQAVYTDAAIRAHGGDWGIIGVAGRSRRIVDAMRTQDNLYTVLTVAPGELESHVPAVHTEAFVGFEQPGRVVDRISAPDTKIVTLTVTEHGYTFSPTTGGLDLDSSDVLRDLSTPEGPRTSIGQIAHGLHRRMVDSGAPISILSCDNLASNGDRTRRLVGEFIDRLPRDVGRLRDWVEDYVTFPNSMVDRIVPATTDSHREQVFRLSRYRDAVPVPAEPFTMWVMEDSFAAGRPSWEAGGAVFSADVHLYEQMKLRLLNGTHSLIAYLGALSDCATIPESIGRGMIAESAHRVLAGEYLPSVQMPSGVSAQEYEDALFQRWSNSALGHRTSQVGSDGSVKLPQRVSGPALRALDRGVMPQYLALSVAAYLACLAPVEGFDPGEHAGAISDPAREVFAALAAESGDPAVIARSVFERGRIFPEELAARAEFVDRVADYLRIITTFGVDAAIGEAENSFQIAHDNT